MSIVSGIRTLFGGGRSAGDAQQRRKGGPPKITPDDVPPGALAELWAHHDARMPKAPRRIEEARAFLAGQRRAPMPAEFDVDDRESCRADGAAKYTRAHHTARRLGAKRPRIKRPTAGESRAAAQVATGTEQFAEGVLQRLYPHMAATENLTNEAELFLFSTPAPCFWQELPTLYDEFEEDGRHLTEDEYGELPAERRREYEPTGSRAGETARMLAMAAGQESGVGSQESGAKTGTRYKRIRAQYRRGKDGRADDGSDGFELDRRATNAAFADELEYLYKRTIPLVHELVHRTDCVPINPREAGDRIEVDGVIRRSLFSRSELIDRGYTWTGIEDQLEPVSERDGQDGDFWLYEYRSKDRKQRPFIVWQVGERSATGYAGQDTAVVKLWELYPGITEFLVHYDLGMRWSGANWDLNSIPFTRPYMQDLLNRDALLTGMTIAGWTAGFPTWGQIITEESAAAMAAVPGDVDVEFRMRPNSVVPLYGTLVDLSAKGTNLDIKTLLVAYGDDVKEEMPSAGAFGGPGPTSGLDRQVTGRDMELGLGDIVEAERRMYEAAGRFTLMICSALARKSGRPVELWIMADQPVAQSGHQTTTYTTVTLTAEQCGNNFDVQAEYPNVPGENLAGASLFLTLMEKGAILREEFRTLWGDPSPEIFEAKLRLQRFYDSEAGQLDLLQGLADYLADDRMKQVLELTAKGQWTGPNGGFASSAMQDLRRGRPAGPGAAPSLPPGPGGAPGAPGMQLVNPGQLALAGGNAGALQASAAAAGGPLDGFSAPGGLGAAA